MLDFTPHFGRISMMVAKTSSDADSHRQLPGELRIALGCRILERRRLLRWSQQRLAETIGGQAVRISRIENGHVSPSLAEAVLLARGLEVSLDELVLGAEGTGGAKPKADPAAFRLRTQARAFEAIGSRHDLEVVAELLEKLIANRHAARTRPEKP